MGADEEGTLARLNAHRREFLEPTVAEHRGRVVKRTGDGMLVEFASVVDAVRCAIEVQRGMAQRNAGVDRTSASNSASGFIVGDIIVEDGDIFGDGVNIAARLEGIAEPGGICISDDACRQVRDKLEARVHRSRRAGAQEHRAAGARLSSAPRCAKRRRRNGVRATGAARQAVDRGACRSRT